MRRARGCPSFAMALPDIRVLLSMRCSFAPYIFDARISNAKEMLNLGLSAIYETGEVPWDQDAEKELVYSIPWEANTAPVDIPYILLRRSEGLSARHVAALAQKWGAFMWEDGFQVRYGHTMRYRATHPLCQAHTRRCVACSTCG